jgi:two-component system response regulator HydG
MIATTLLISSDPALDQTVRGVTQPIGGLRVAVVADADAACARLERDDAAVAVVHVTRESDAAGATRLLRQVTAAKKPLPVLVVAEQYVAEQALTLLRQGAVDYLSRPLDLSRLSYLLDMLTVRARYAEPQPAPAAEPAVECVDGAQPYLYLSPTGADPLMDQVQRIAPQDTTVLLTGETGTGKTRLARLIHELSPRRQKQFLVVNCGALSASLIESEMFGHLRGAFTGADRDRVGKFAQVGQGTLLLDDIDALPLDLQAKLLRTVEDRVFEPVGSNQPQPMQARLIAASNRALDQEAAAGRFRSDLFYRLNVVGFHLSPLRERRCLIQPLADQFVAEFAARNGRPVHGLAAAALRAMAEYNWPGNIRELRNVIERAVALCAGPEIRPEDLPEAIRSAAASALPGKTSRWDAADTGTLDQAKEDAEMMRITAALQRNNNNRLRAAAELGISRMTLYKKLHKYGLMEST